MLIKKTKKSITDIVKTCEFFITFSSFLTQLKKCYTFKEKKGGQVTVNMRYTVYKWVTGNGWY